ncbi:MAG: T9SS C-terminal target domain-containing protein [Flavobacterium sp.]|nr:MAG: T9SS C-terminal target domain-containing protein [Flavobacterium sp.]
MKYYFAVLLALVFLNSSAQEKLIEPEIHHKWIRTKKKHVDPKLSEGSGLEYWRGRLWSHNDSGDAELFALDTIGNIVETYDLPGVKNDDWEDMTQDDSYFYIGQTGNNVNDKETLHVLRVEKESLLQHHPQIETITFKWPEVDDRGSKEKINFNCEAVVKAGDSLYFFTKEWKSRRCTRVFSIPAKPGTYTARYIATIATKVLITGANYDQKQKKLALCGYNLLAHPFILLFPDTDMANFSPKKMTKIKLRRMFRQIEGITTDGKGGYYLVNEDMHFLLFHTKPELHHVKRLRRS